MKNQKKYRLAYKHYKAAYDYKAKDELLFHIAHNADQYFKDKRIAMQYFEKYKKTNHKKISRVHLTADAPAKRDYPPNENIDTYGYIMI